MLNILFMIVLHPIINDCSEIIISTTLRFIYSDCNFSLPALLSSGIIVIIIIIIIKKGRQCKAEREWYTPYQSEDPSPTIPTYR